MTIFPRAHIYGDKGVGFGTNCGLATVKQVRARSTNGVLDDVSDEGSKYNRDEE
jgi:hypothetical protein